MEHFKKILLCTDFSEPAEKAAKRAAMLKGCCDAELVLIHIINYVPPVYMGVELPPIYADNDVMEESARNHLSQWAEEQGLGDCQQIVASGQVKKTIVDTADEIGADLVVLGAHSETGLSRLFGSVAHAVAQSAHCDVLVAR